MVIPGPRPNINSCDDSLKDSPKYLPTSLLGVEQLFSFVRKEFVYHIFQVIKSANAKWCLLDFSCHNITHCPNSQVWCHLSKDLFVPHHFYDILMPFHYLTDVWPAEQGQPGRPLTCRENYSDSDFPGIHHPHHLLVTLWQWLEVVSR